MGSILNHDRGDPNHANSLQQSIVWVGNIHDPLLEMMNSFDVLVGFCWFESLNHSGFVRNLLMLCIRVTSSLFACTETVVIHHHDF